MAPRKDNNDRWLEPENLEDIDLTYRRLGAGDIDGVLTEVADSVARAFEHLERNNPGYTRPDLDAADHMGSVELEPRD